jgi:hypothetical protein
MALNPLPTANTTKQRLDQANPDTLADQLRAIGLGHLVREQRATLRRQNPNAQAAGVASSYDLATLQALFLPDDAKAFAISAAYARANSGSVANGPLTVAAFQATPTTTQVGISPAGNIVFLGSDEYTDVDVEYTSYNMDVVELTLNVVAATGVCAIPTVYAGTAGAGTPATALPNVPNNVPNAAGVVILLEAEALVGTTTGKKIVLAPAASAPATTKACLDTTKKQVFFATADAVTSARIKIGVFPSVDRNAVLEAQSALF